MQRTECASHDVT